MKIRFKQALSKNNPNNPYSCKEFTANVGDVVEVSDVLGGRLMCDFPGKFVELLDGAELEVLSDDDMAELDIEVVELDAEEIEAAKIVAREVARKKNMDRLKKLNDKKKKEGK